jgi:hypothetical protein
VETIRLPVNDWFPEDVVAVPMAVREDGWIAAGQAARVPA